MCHGNQFGVTVIQSAWVVDWPTGPQCCARPLDADTVAVSPLEQATLLLDLLEQPWHHLQRLGCRSGDPRCPLTQSLVECQS